jgi:hypothetical protein
VGSRYVAVVVVVVVALLVVVLLVVLIVVVVLVVVSWAKKTISSPVFLFSSTCRGPCGPGKVGLHVRCC